MSSEKYLRSVLSQLVLSISAEKVDVPSEISSDLQPVTNCILYILKGDSSKLIHEQDYYSLLFTDASKKILESFPSNDLYTVLNEYLHEVINNFEQRFQEETISKLHLQIIAIALLQTFIQLNFTGPGIEFNSQQLFFPGVDEKTVQLESIKLINIEGEQAYELMVDPLFFIISCLLFEKLMQVDSRLSLVNKTLLAPLEEIIEATGNICSASPDDPVKASLQWWRARALQVHLSLISEPASVLSSVSSLLLNPSVANALAPAIDDNLELKKHIQLVYFLECARSGIHSQTEHLAIPLLGKARKLSELNFVISGAKAKRTKFQTFHTSALIILAKSKKSTLFDNENDNPETFGLESDLLLEKPQFESLDDLELQDEPNSKRIKIDEISTINDEEGDEEKLLPIAMRQDDIPDELKALDPNEQPALNDLDSVQLLLRLTTLRQTTPSNNPLVEEELLALASRILYASSKSVNWSIFSRALWERSILETTKARTIERGILQMTSLVEEIGIKVKTRIIPQAMEEGDEEGSSAAASRLRFIHQLPLMPQWAMDMRLAEKYMSLGVLRSAVEIYERLQLSCETALCYAAADEEKEAERIILERINSHPEDARAVSILGDIRQDPNLWMKAWEIGKYSKAKASLSRYFYNPPQSSGLTKDLEQAIKHMNDCLTANPLSYEHWFFYGCCGLESHQYEVAAEAFTRCVALDDTNSHAWSNLASALLRTDKTRPALNALKKAIRCAGESNKSWRIYENYLIVAAKLNEWNDVLIAARELINIRGNSDGEGSIDIPIIEKLVEILVATEYPSAEDTRFTHYQKSCIDLVCNILPSVITKSARCWRIVARVELWRQKPWAALECHEKAYRALSQRPELETDESAWNEAIDSCSDLVAAYESLGELPGKHDAGDLVCKDWKYKAKTTVRSLMSKGKAMWEDSEGWYRLQDMKEQLLNN